VTITVSPTSVTISPGQTKPFKATGHYSDQSTKDLTSSATWSSSNTSVATVSNTPGSQGLAAGVGVGGTQITATDALTGIHGSGLLTVVPVPGLTITPSSGPAGTAVRITGTAFKPGLRLTIVYKRGFKVHQIHSGVSNKMCVVAVAPDGTFACNTKILDSTHAGAKGPHPVVAKGWRHHKVSTTFTLTP
jgi:hypothetical protein